MTILFFTILTLIVITTIYEFFYQEKGVIYDKISFTLTTIIFILMIIYGIKLIG